MSTTTITQLPVAISIGANTDYLEIARYTANPVALYQAYRCTPQQIANAFINRVPSGVEYTITNLGSPIITGVQPYLTMPYAASIISATMVASPSGSITVDVWKCSYSQFDGGVTHPVVADTICAGSPLSISGGTKTQSTIPGWIISLNQGDVLAFNVSSASGVTQATITLNLSRTLS